MSAGNDQGEHRKGDIPVFEKRGFDMGLDMVDPEERLSKIIGQPFGEGEADEKRADEARSLGHGKMIDLLEGDAGAVQAFADDVVDRFEVLARSELGDDAAVGRVDFVLGENDIAQDSSRRRRTAAAVSSQDVSMATGVRSSWRSDHQHYRRNSFSQCFKVLS